MDTALDPLLEGKAKRCGVIRTKDVARRTVLLLLRFRYHLITRRGREETPLLAEACEVVAFRGRAHAPEWLSKEEAEALLHAEPAANIAVQQARALIENVLADVELWQDAWRQMAGEQSRALKEAHSRVRAAARQTGVQCDVQPHLPADVLGLYVLLPTIT
jgi:hypothetical protein